MEHFQSPAYQLKGVADTRQGGRPENQDDYGFVETPLGYLAVVCDGMGGGPGGKTASYIAKFVFMETLQGFEPTVSPQEAMKIAIAKANDALFMKMQEVPSLQGMGSTLVAVLFTRQAAFVAHLGDSRCYRMCGKKVMFRTADHSLVGELVRNKTLTEEQARTSPQSNIITRGLGNTSNHNPEIAEVPYLRGDRFILCTDGVWGIMQHEDLLTRFSAHHPIENLVLQLQDETDKIGNASGGYHDNHTIIIIETNTNSLLKDKMSKHLRIVFAALSALLAISLLFNIASMLTRPKPVEENTIAIDRAKYTRLKAIESRYNKIFTEGSADFTSAVKVLTDENDNLRMKIKELEEQVSTLTQKLTEASEKQVQAPSQPSSQPIVATNRPQNYASAKSAASSSGAKNDIDQIINSLNQMMTISGVDVKKVNKQITDHQKKILSLLDEFDSKTNRRYQSKTNGIRGVMTNKGKTQSPAAVISIDTKTKKYRATDSAKEHLKKMKTIAEELKKKL